MAKVIFRVIGEEQPLTWTVPQGRVTAVKNEDGKSKGKKFINYYPGHDSVFTEDITNKDVTFTKVPEFTYNALAKKTQLSFEDDDLALLNYLKTHPWYNVKYELYSAEKQAQRDIDIYERKEMALERIKVEDPTEIQALGLAIIGLDCFTWPVLTIKAKLKQLAFENPDKILNSVNASDYFARHTASLAFCANIVKNNDTHTAVVWNDHGQGVLVHVAKGENAVDKLTELLAYKNKESETLLQEFQNRLDKAGANENNGASITDNILSAKDKEIAELKAKLAAQAGGAAKETVDTTGLSLEEASAKYKEIKGDDVPVRYKNDLAWITSKLNA